MRTWISFRTGIRGIRVGASLPNPAARVYQVSAIGRKVWRIGSTVMLVGLAIWLFTSRDHEGRLSENFLLVIIMVLAVRYLFKQAVVWATEITEIESATPQVNPPQREPIEAPAPARPELGLKAKGKTNKSEHH
jgi:hypothetical protein